MIVKWLLKLELEVLLGGALVSEQLETLPDFHDQVDWPRVLYGQGHHYDRTDRADVSPGRCEDAGEPSARNWTRFDPGTFKSL